MLIGIFYCKKCIINITKPYLLLILCIFSEQNLHENGTKWNMERSMGTHRHLPGVGTHNGQIFVVGGSNDSWEAQSVVEFYDPATTM